MGYAYQHFGMEIPTGREVSVAWFASRRSTGEATSQSTPTPERVIITVEVMVRTAFPLCLEQLRQRVCLLYQSEKLFGGVQRWPGLTDLKVMRGFLQQVRDLLMGRRVRLCALDEG